MAVAIEILFDILMAVFRIDIYVPLPPCAGGARTGGLQIFSFLHSCAWGPSFVLLFILSWLDILGVAGFVYISLGDQTSGQ